MASKRVLVVDDSKSARVILSRMLEKYAIDVDTAESAELAIEYLKSNRPDAIFMDHLMPGMDGLQAVKAIKSNPQTAMIPIMMYTSQEGELYVGQARALGAMGVLPKQVRPVDVSKVLYELHLLPDRRDTAEPALAPVELLDGTPIDKAAAVSGPRTAGAPDWGRWIESAVKEQTIDLRRFMIASMESFAARIVSDLRDAKPETAMEFAPPPVPAARASTSWALAAGAAALIAAAFAASWVGTREELAKSRAEVAALQSANAELQRTRADLSAALKEFTAAAPAAPGVSGAAASSANPPHVEQVPYGEIPFDKSRLDALRDLLTKLEGQNFHGIVKLTSASGLFCLSGNPTDGFTPAPSATLASKCDLIGNPFDESLSGQQRQSLAFANLIAGVRQRTAGAITVAIENAGSNRPSTPYPIRIDSLTAGEWNRAAAANNRVEFEAQPGAEQ
jgi:CheY-like chemotaxis protein